MGVMVVRLRIWVYMSRKGLLERRKCIQVRLASNWVKVEGQAAGSKYGRALALYWKLITVFSRDGRGMGTVGQSFRDC